jgi:hypothetical protein
MSHDRALYRSPYSIFHQFLVASAFDPEFKAIKRTAPLADSTITACADRLMTSVNGASAPIFPIFGLP